MEKYYFSDKVGISIQLPVLGGPSLVSLERKLGLLGATGLVSREDTTRVRRATPRVHCSRVMHH